MNKGKISVLAEVIRLIATAIISVISALTTVSCC